ncbi:MAG: hypothetical protein A2679_03545 [Candidatus Sungbacteria bacterium RIFCSPHIGHO2_01_FULL_54_26]|uniref:Hydroxyacid dehydrogenase n=1 Tax=Candidatus Sungbacteria bacterium RIFCSPHIGHO2_02_FULL_53_17 TaxID=1802275 RepID=A0A1G2KX48_9BACT|nr:MAG: hypothetical protein A2679_03545 [Candidatus Sungbacteria bacterium RIFCSPHIGHO2_01_FULL_54_26]OHA04013.1 MAG: hypothetical protein A3C92_03670 [Candidatus Sungbacteria bacterium RIFCSPHIGHO2_02_FULL_53_17]
MKILHTDFENYPSGALAMLETLGNVVRRKPETREAFLRLVADADILIVRMDTVVDRALINAAPRLVIVGSATTGINHLDMDALEEHGIAVITLRGETTLLQEIPSTAEHAMGLILALLRRIPWSFDAVRRRTWESFAFQGHELKGRVIGLVGCGRVGAMVAGFSAAFGMRVLGYDPHRDAGELASAGIEAVSLEGLLRHSDIVSLHPLLTEETAGMIGASEFALMKKEAVLINTARGELVDEAALLHVLETGGIAGAALDVLQHEKDLYAGRLAHPLIAYAEQRDNLLITPHIAGMAVESVWKTSEYIARRIVVVAKRLEKKARDTP